VQNEARQPPVVAVDIGGTKIAAAVITHTGEIHERLREPVPSSVMGLVQCVGELVRRVTVGASAPPQVLGVSVAGLVETGCVSVSPNLPQLVGFDLASALQERTGLRVELLYDGHAGALGEAWRGAGRGMRTMAFLIIGTGVGGGFVVDGRVHPGAHQIAGAVGWMIVEEPIGQEARDKGALETVVAGPALTRAAEAELARGVNSALRSPVDARSLLTAASAGDPLAVRILDNAAGVLARAVVGIVSILDTDVVVLGGGLGARCSRYRTRSEELLRELGQPVMRETPVVHSMLGDDAFLVGAAAGTMASRPEDPSLLARGTAPTDR
jgi:glucokinase